LDRPADAAAASHGRDDHLRSDLGDIEARREIHVDIAGVHRERPRAIDDEGLSDEILRDARAALKAQPAA
jgi:hypothetical protein